MKKKLAVLVLTGIMALGMTACGGSTDSGNASDTNTEADATTETDTTTEADTNAGDWDSTRDITVVSREDGSGTRGAFIELFGIQEEVDGEKVDMTTEEANITNSTSVMMSTVAQDEYSIGYISLGSLDDTVKALKIDGTEATADNIKAGTYKISRPFNIAVKEGLSDAAQDFVNFILSTEGQEVVADNKYIPLDDTQAYASNGASGKVVVAGSSSVSPVMEKLKEAYASANSNVEIEIQTSDSTTGMQNTIDGVCEIGMASRELKDSELEQGLTPTVIALDGIAVVVNNDNPTDDMTSDQVKSIFTGDVLTWEDALN
ncbi:MAG: substrate-binding domain-containing protein [Blautia sp.]|nr:substrate-binding domain-containing protein [Bacillota bacterium]MDY3715073.1 substrate-binding domain-containing protein [Blautia sp.]